MLMGDRCRGQARFSGHGAGLEEPPRGSAGELSTERWGQAKGISRSEDSLFKGLTVLVGQSGRCGQSPGHEAEWQVRASDTAPRRLDLFV